ncbi:MAG: hypothetical protein H6600_02825 [Flavobacteriales bacterium]|nr:hypothetical protein [Flavobacteriales bacterium]MCB9197364.1 hypothetical protein [Flavobacteriales bacterium]
MNNELFDRMIKDNLNGIEVTPSAGVKKALAWKLFFQNMLVFHKIKLMVGLAFIATSGLVIGYSIPESDQLLTNKLVVLSGELDKVINSKGLIAETEIPDNKGVLQVQDVDNLNYQIDSFIEIEEEAATKKVEEEMVIKSTEFIGTTPKINNSSKGTSKASKVDKGSNTEIIDNSSFTETSIALNREEKIKLNEGSDFSLFKGVSKKSELITTDVNNELAIGNLNKINFTYRTWSFDLYKGLLSNSSITSELKDAMHEKYYWDFHGGNDVLKANYLGGFNANYIIGREFVRLKVSAGVDYFELHDQKAHYQFESITDPDWLNFFNTDELAWVNTMGEDTCTQCFYAHNTEELHEQLSKKYNKYSYVRAPINLGMQINLKYVSLDLQGGVAVNHLVKSQGLYIKNGLNPNYEKFYYWDDMQLSTLDNENEMLRKNYFSWNLGANLRVRVTRNFDLFAGYQIGQSIGSITNSDYLMNKTVKYSNGQLGITYYPFRYKLTPSFLRKG